LSGSYQAWPRDRRNRYDPDNRHDPDNRYNRRIKKGRHDRYSRADPDSYCNHNKSDNPDISCNPSNRLNRHCPQVCQFPIKPRKPFNQQVAHIPRTRRIYHNLYNVNFRFKLFNR
jgi:hypothetical protein